MDLDPAHLRSFLAIVRYGGYHRAAEALHLTQPAVSRHMRRLEQQLGEPLFTKAGRGVELTPFGERAAAELATALEAHDRALARLRRDDGPYVLGAIENLADPLLPEILAAVRARLGGRELQLRVDRSLELVDRVAQGEVDAAIVLDHGDAAVTEIGAIPLRWWATPPLASAELPEPLPLVAYDPPCGLRELALAQLRLLGLPHRFAAQSPHLSGVHTAVRHGLGYALLAAGGDGLRAVTSGPLAGVQHAPLFLAGDPALVEPLRAVLRPRALSAAA